MSARFELIETPLAGLKVLERIVRGDARGFFERMYCAHELEPVLAHRTIVQINHTFTVERGTVRGMHFQRPPHAETKLVSCLRGEVFDVAVDLRQGSKTLLAWHGEILSAKNHRTMLIPEGFAHGFQCLSDDCELLYLHTAAYEPSVEDGLNAEDPALAIAWPAPVRGRSTRDIAFPLLRGPFTGVTV